MIPCPRTSVSPTSGKPRASGDDPSPRDLVQDIIKGKPRASGDDPVKKDQAAIQSK